MGLHAPTYRPQHQHSDWLVTNAKQASRLHWVMPRVQEVLKGSWLVRSVGLAAPVEKDWTFFFGGGRGSSRT